ncbi:MAG TPA: zf-HC2 domain-containing protein, partial [Thermomicrobiales bacterium]|nr:zf-HC2 domain-containing protein [Thermomicrobiales bacterium]
MSIPSPSPVPSGALDDRRLRAALRLFLPPDRADSAASDIMAAADTTSGLRQLAGDLARERWLKRVRASLSMQSTGATLPAGASERALLMLVVHLGLDLEGEWLEDAFGLDGGEAGRELLRARAALSGQSLPACRECDWMIGRYRDRSLPADDRLRLLSHVTTCERCRSALDRAQQIDADLCVAINQREAALPDRPVAMPASRPKRAAGNMTVTVGAVVALLAIVVGFSVIGDLFSNPRPAVPLFVNESVSTAPLDGWLLQVSTVGYLEGVNLSNGRKRGLDSGDGGNFSPLYRVSKTHIAAWRPSDGQRDDVLTIGPIGDQFRFRLTWNRRFVYWYPSGWLDDDTLLIVKSPEHIDGETEQAYIDRLARDSRLIAFDAQTGAEQVLMTGNVAAAFPSPDGTMLAIIQPVDRRWPGNSLELRPFDGRHVGEPIAQIDHRVAADGVWLADSSRFVASVITDETVSRLEAISDASLAQRGVSGVALVAIDRNGGQQTLVSATIPETIVPMAASPDGRSVVYEVRKERPRSAFPGIPDYAWRCYQLMLSGGEPALLASGESPERTFTPAWSPDGTTLVLPVARGFPLATDDRLTPPIIPNATALLVFRPGTDPEVIYSSGRDLYGWLGPEALLPRAGTGSDGSRTLASVELTEVDLDRLSIDARSTASGGD